MTSLYAASNKEIDELENFPFTIKYAGIVRNPFNDDSRSVMDMWQITFTKGYDADSTNFYTGLGHRGTPKHIHRKLDDINKFPIYPTKKAVMYSLLLDAEAMHQSFDDWCDNFGFDHDSISALNTYQKCCAIGKLLKKYLTSEQIKHAQVILENY